jgi:hypothetical protein
LVATPLLAVAVLAIFLAWGQTFAGTAHAADPTNGQMSLSVISGGTACPGSSTADACAIKNQSFTIRVNLDKTNAGGFVGIQTEVNYGTLVYKPTTNAADEIKWPCAAFCSRSPGAPTGAEGIVNHGGATGSTPPFPASSYTGPVIELVINCTATNSTGNVIDLVPLDGANTDGTGLKPDGGGADIPLSDSMTVDCVQAPTATPVPPTNTPPANPQMQKLCTVGSTTSNLCNLFLTRQNNPGKVPPTTCAGGNNTVTLAETLSIPIPTVPDPKDPSIDQELGAFEFEVHFDPDKVCVNITPGTAVTGTLENPQTGQFICIIEDKDSSSLEGVARIGCVTVGKTFSIDTTTPEGRLLANIVVRPQPDEYSVIKPNQDNGNVVQLNNVACELADLQGHPIPVFSCEDADVTIRYLEGDVEPDCTVNALDTQAIAFRWGVNKGSLIYTAFMNLEPSGPQADNDIDIKDLQFVFGRFGSTCAAPHPAQPPVNAKL